MGRDDWEEERAVPYLLANPLVPNIATAKFTLIEPDFDACGSQSVSDTLRRLAILRGIAQEYGSSRVDHRGVAPWPRLGTSCGAPPTSPANVSLPQFGCPLPRVASGCLGSGV